MTCLVIALSSPSGPVSSSPLARAALTSSRTAARSTSAGVSDFFAALSSGLTPTSVSVIIRPFPLNQSARWASYTVTRTVSLITAALLGQTDVGFVECGDHLGAPVAGGR